MDGVWNISSDFHSCYHRFNQISSNWPLYNSHWSHLQENTLLRAFLFYLYINLYILFYLYPPIQHGNCSFNFPTAWEHQDTESSALSQQEELGSTKHMQKLNWETQAVLCIKKIKINMLWGLWFLSFATPDICVILELQSWLPLAQQQIPSVWSHHESSSSHRCNRWCTEIRLYPCAGEVNKNIWH